MNPNSDFANPVANVNGAPDDDFLVDISPDEGCADPAADSDVIDGDNSDDNPDNNVDDEPGNLVNRVNNNGN